MDDHAADAAIQVFPDDARLEVLAAYTDHLEELVAVYRDAAAGDGSLLDRAPAEGAWTVAQVVHHLADYELAHAMAVRRILVEDEPGLVSLDPDRCASVLAYDVRPPEDALTLILALRHVNSRLLASLPAAAWVRTCRTSDGREVELAALARAAADHLGSHVLQGRRAVIGLP